MSDTKHVYNKLTPFFNDPLWKDADSRFKQFFTNKAQEYRMTNQDIRNCLVMQRDFEMWHEPGLESIWQDTDPQAEVDKNRTKKAITYISKRWSDLKSGTIDYSLPAEVPDQPSIIHVVNDSEDTILGDCPVASEKTRCCNLKTLDVVTNCGFSCSYCSIQTFYHQGKVYFHHNLDKKLDALYLDPAKRYHIGTGQSSDSLMWGNQYNILNHLFKFARENQNTALELKSKSSNISYLMKNEIPKNIISTWTLNTQPVIDHEEHGTASLQERLQAAASVASKGNLVGFHFHPVILYKGWKDDYRKIADFIIENININRICLISIGTLTFIKPVIKKLRERKSNTKVLQIPLTEAEGKYSYSLEEKKMIFSYIYSIFSPLHTELFFYLCMEDPSLWEPVFGFNYKSNEEFENAMLKAYFRKISNL